MKPVKTIPVGIIVERVKADSQWADYLWKPVEAVAGNQKTKAWTKLSDDGSRVTYYAGSSEIELYPSDTPQYRDNVLSETPSIWVGLRAAESDPPFELFLTTADSSEGEGMTYTGTVICEPVPMPDAIQAVIEQFITEHHVERVFFKRKRDKSQPNLMERRIPIDESDKK